MTTDMTRELNERFCDAYLAGDAEAIGALLADGVIHRPPPSLAIPMHLGRDATAAALTEPLGRGQLDSGSLTRETTLNLADGDGALVKFAVSAKTVRDTDYRNEIAFLITWQDGEIIEIHEFGDTLNDYDRHVVEEVPAWP